MGKKCLIVCSSRTGNTAKVAARFKTTFERQGWECEAFIISQDSNLMDPPFSFQDYDFVCVGSGVLMHEPQEEILILLRKQFFGIDPRLLTESREKRISINIQSSITTNEKERPLDIHHKIVLREDSKKAVVFATYAGNEFGPKEAEPSLQLLALEIEHLGFKCIGKFCCPGKSGNYPLPHTYHGDIRDRPNEKDLLKAEMFIEEKLEEIADRTA
jgi:menaquinone-dependent protoporphyrinogen IX oxidase